MPIDCGIDEKVLGELKAKRAERAEPLAGVPKAERPASITDLAWPVAPIWVSAGPLPNTDPPPTLRESLLLRDALGELARIFFSRPQPVPIATSWTPAITPGLLEGAARWGMGEGPLVSVFTTTSGLAHDPFAKFADWTRGRVIEVPLHHEVRKDLAAVPYRCAILLGGGPAEKLDADVIQHTAQSGGPPVFAVASTGGTAAERYKAEPAAFGSTASHLELEKPTSYTLLMKRILEATEPPRNRDPNPFPSGGGPGGREHHVVRSPVLVAEPETVAVVSRVVART